MPGGAKRNKSPNIDREAKLLCRLLELINIPASKQQHPPKKYAAPKKLPTAGDTAPIPKLETNQKLSFEAVELEKFSLKYKDERLFSSHSHHKYFSEICVSLTKNRLCSQEWLTSAPPENILRVLMCLRILLRDSSYQKLFFNSQGTRSLAEYFLRATDEYLYSTDGPYSVDILKEMTNIFQKLSASVDRCECLVQCQAHVPLVRLLTASDVIVLHCSLYALIGLAQSEGPKSQIGKLNAVEILLRIIQEYDTISKKLAANLLRLLCSDPKTREDVKLENGVPILLSQLHSDNVSLLWHVVWCLVLLCEDAECRDDIRQMGGIPLILSLLHDRKFVSERTDASDSAVGSAGNSRKPVSNKEQEEFSEHQYSLKKACCAALAELVLNDANGQQIIQSNGLYSLGLLILPQDITTEKDKKRATKLQQNAFRALRFLFSMERNRRLFKQLFPPELFEIFIDVGHYNRELVAYRPLADKINSLPLRAIGSCQLACLHTPLANQPVGQAGQLSFTPSRLADRFLAWPRVLLKREGALRDNVWAQYIDGRYHLSACDSSLQRTPPFVRVPSSARWLECKIDTLPEGYRPWEKHVISEIAENIRNTNQNKKPNYYIGDYAVFELLGTGAFGSVYKVRKRTGRQSFMALKEVNLQNTAFGKNDKEKATSVGEITNELKIMKEEMRHPNVVRYYKTFELNDKLYIVMELIEGAHLGEHFNSLKEKNERFQEGRIWNIMIQLILALRYLHKEKGIVHRDLTPSNIMLGENDKVTITDFGLAKQKRSDCSKMTSVVGTILYSCPEVVQNQAYGEKADIWAMGCILYQMCVLEPPFNSNNMLTLVKKIVAADYKPISEKDYSARLLQTVKSCLCVAPEDRPDILQLSGQLSDILLRQMDVLRISQTAMEKKLDKERKRTQKHYIEANQNMQNYHRLFLASQEGYDKLTNLSGSGGAEGLKESAASDAFGDDKDTGIGSSVALSLSSIRFGDVSDEDSYPSSGSESRESSAGSMRSQHPFCTPFLQNQPVMQRHVQRQDMNYSCLGSLELEIPSAAKTSRDSGICSGDPSPNASNSPSSQNMDYLMNGCNQLRHNIIHSCNTSDVGVHFLRKMDKRSRSAAMLAISPSRLREINDPIQQMMQQLHKIIYITQLPPTLSPNPNRRILEQYKRALFSAESNAMNLKSEMRKLLQGSRDIIDMNLGNPEYLKRSSLGSELDSPLDPDKPATPFYDPDYKDVGITYEYMQTILETLLEESGYYNVATASKR